MALTRVPFDMQKGKGFLLSGVSNLAPVNGQAIQLMGRTSAGDGGEGLFVFDNSDLSTEVALDTLQGIYIAPSIDLTGASGAWVRSLDGPLNPLWFGATRDGVTDDTAAIQAAIDHGPEVRIPEGSFVVDNLRMKDGVRILGEGKDKTKLLQDNGTNPAVYCLSDATTGQIIKAALKSLTIKGTNTSGHAPALKVEATAPYVVSFSDFDVYIEESSTAFEIAIAGANEVYSNKFRIIAVTTQDTAMITEGVYNEFWLEAVVTNGQNSLIDSSLNSVFHYLVTDGTIQMNGQNNTFINPTIETIYGASSYDNCAFRIAGYNNVLINPTLTDVANAKAVYGYRLYNRQTIIHPRTWGANYPAYPFNFDAAAQCTIISGVIASTYKLEQYCTVDALLMNTFVGDVTSYYTYKNNNFKNPSFSTGASAYTVDSLLSSQGLDYAISFSYAAGTATITLPSGTAQIGRELVIATRQAQAVVSASANVVPFTGGAGTAILAATIGKWARLQCVDGTNWNIIANN